MNIEVSDLGIDYSSARPDPGMIVDDGYVFVCRYLAPSSDGSKVVSLAEARVLWAVDLDLVLVWEHGASDALLGASAGTTAGEGVAFEAGVLGWPADRPIYYGSTDFDVTPAQYAVCAQYLDAAIAASGHPGGPYSPRGYLDWCLTNGHGTFGWQAASNYGRPENMGTSLLANICQRVGGASLPSTDIDVALKTDVGGWIGGQPPTPPTPTGDQVEELRGSVVIGPSGWGYADATDIAGLGTQPPVGVDVDQADPTTALIMTYEGSSFTTAHGRRLWFHGATGSHGFTVWRAS